MLTVSEFDYDLPEALIAQTPVEPRDSSRLLVVNRETGALQHKSFFNIVDFIKPGDLLVANDTKVIPARLIGKRADTGGRVEVFLLHRQSQDIWEVLVKPGKKMRPGQQVVFDETLRCEVKDVTEYGGRIIRFHYEGLFETVLDKLGETPLPPYIHQKLADPSRYQTVYARDRGSAAAPTAGLHFTPELMDKVRAKGASFAFITLNIGLGTFRPVRIENIAEHVMHREFYSVSPETAELIRRTKQQGGRIVAVGTTAVRTLESASAGGKLESGSGWSELFIYPGYDFKVIDALITNFHLPQSTLLMLVSAFAGKENMLAAYREAVRLQYRFFSFGDAMFLG
ncbi:MAG TPA: tRNA preQ1(34) S-adenosylmethionine ribosyltransferase-isomerase QueA [Negativicutes bacterium]|nr:tRNA preQ1(34) S-adenosylmethionine ribosyltransferase-isomerase QueA [Negativicutes bacterium]